MIVLVDLSPPSMKSMLSGFCSGSKGCDSAPCQNGGTCRDDVTGAVHCDCPSGYSGQSCEAAIGESVFVYCLSSLCLFLSTSLEMCKRVCVSFFFFLFDITIIRMSSSFSSSPSS